jgi:predicted O-linked N-acetylglucosamine transferase (SPINDLY family)
MPTLSEALAIAIEHHRAGRLGLAEEIYRRILAVEPEHADALHLLGVLVHQLGRHQLALEYLDRAVAICPTAAAYHNNRGEVYRAMHDYAAATPCYERALQLAPDDAASHSNLGAALRSQGRLDEAIEHLRRAVQLHPDFADAHNNLGNAWQDLGKLADAVACYRRAVQFRPDYAEAYNNLGDGLRALGSLDEAVACCRQALRLKPNLAQAHNNLAAALQAQGEMAQAIEHYRHALQLQPDFAVVHNNLGNALLISGDREAAIGHCRRAVALKPDYAEAHNNLGNALQGQGKLDAAIGCHQRALQLRPNYAEAYNNLGNALQAQGRQDEAIHSYRQALQLSPNNGVIAQNHLCALRYVPFTTPDAMAAALADYERRHAVPLKVFWRPHANSHTTDRPLRLGFVSPRFAHGPVAAFLIRTLENLDRHQFPLTLYDNGPTRDDMTQRFQAVADTWREVASWTDERLAEQIRDDGVDILFDLAGHAPRNRLLVFARRPAPVQITWIDSVGTTGLAAIDYLLADRWTIPEQAATHCAERILRMPDGYICYTAPPQAPAVGPLPALRDGRLTFGSFNNPAKIHRQVVDVWSRILKRVPGSRLVLKYLGLDDPGARQHYAGWFAECGLAADRVDFRGPSTWETYLHEYQEIDLGLDPFPHSGGLTTCDALWMGVPVVTCPGPSFAGRQSLSHLSNIGFHETIARNLDDYVERAVELAADLSRLAAIRAGLRAQIAASPLCDGPRFAANLMTLLRNVWRDWCVK